MDNQNLIDMANRIGDFFDSMPDRDEALAGVAEAQAERRRIWLGWATAALVSATILVGSALSYLRG